MRKPIDLTGQKFGRLNVVSLSPKRSGGHLHWVCDCECGNTITVLGYNLRNGNTKSCGCLQKEKAANRQYKHGQTGSRLFVTWCHMKQRCSNKNDHAYKYYGGRGIKVCAEWLNDFQTFCDWAMSNGYADNLTIDRIDVNGDYCPENCRWVTIKEQQMNKRVNVRIAFNGEIKTLSEWASEFNCRISAVYREILMREGRLLNETY